MIINIGDIVKLDHPAFQSEFGQPEPFGFITAIKQDNSYEVFFFDTWEREIICQDGRGDGMPSLVVIHSDAS
jgi:hypothetical protein|tara:strand:- start:329 stop:544 length:216 start_codon:yes stop_codon:yes gene_type:complete